MLSGIDGTSRAAFRRRIHSIWESLKTGKRLEGEEKVYADLMQQHEEFYNTWEFADDLENYEYDPETGVNPFVHIAFDAVIVNQVTADKPRGITEIYKRLRDKKLDHLEAIHDMARVFVKEFYEISKGRIPYSDERYLRELLKLLNPAPKKKER